MATEPWAEPWAGLLARASGVGGDDAASLEARLEVNCWAARCCSFFSGPRDVRITGRQTRDRLESRRMTITAHHGTCAGRCGSVVAGAEWHQMATGC
jgi:hypothetical protein